MSDVIADLAYIAVCHEPTHSGDACDCGWHWDRREGRTHTEHITALQMTHLRENLADYAEQLGLRRDRAGWRTAHTHLYATD